MFAAKAAATINRENRFSLRLCGKLNNNLCVLCAFAVNVLFPALEPLPAIGEQVFVVLKVQVKAIL
jgi:hypothetical protein